MHSFISSLLKEFEEGHMTRRQLIQSIAMSAAACSIGAEAASAGPTTLGFHTIAVNHVSYDVTGTDYGKARDFYIKLFGMDYPDEHDNGGSAYEVLGPREAGTFFITRGPVRDPNAAPAPPRGDAAGGGGGGGGRGRGGAGDDAARGGRGAGGAGGDAPQRGGGGQQQQRRAAIDQIAITVANWDKKKAEAALKKVGLNPQPDGESFHVVDPFGMDLQICSPKINTY